jgi:hypothetical protein
MRFSRFPRGGFAGAARLFGLALMVFSTAGLYAQQTTYRYTGNNFTSAFPPCTTSSSLHGSVTLSSPVAPNTIWAQVDNAISWSFSDGQSTYDNTNSKLTPPQVGTDSQGVFNSWAVQITVGPPFFTIETVSSVLNPVFAGAGTGDFGDCGSNLNNPGTWSVSPPPLTITTTHLPNARSGAPYTTYHDTHGHRWQRRRLPVVGYVGASACRLYAQSCRCLEFYRKSAGRRGPLPLHGAGH